MAAGKAGLGRTEADAAGSKQSALGFLVQGRRETQLESIASLKLADTQGYSTSGRFRKK